MANKKSIQEKITGEFKNVKDYTNDYETKDIDNNKIMACLAYIVAPFPYFAEKNSKFVKFHATQAMNFFVVEVFLLIISIVLSSTIKVSRSCWGIEDCYLTTPWWVETPLYIMWALMGLIALIGIYNVIGGKVKELPFFNKIKLFK